MSETQIPTAPTPPGQTPRASSAFEPNARLIGVPNEVRAELQTRRAVIRIQGEVVRSNDDGSVRVRTERGDIDVQLREGQPRPREGQRVEVEIQPARNPDRPPETATLRELPRAAETPQQSTNPQTRPSATPVDVQVRPQGETPAPRQPLPVDIRHAASETPQTPQPLPPEGSIVRLQPLPLQIQASLPPIEPLTQAVNLIAQRIDFQTQTISAEVVQQLALPETPLQTAPPQQTTTLQTPPVVTVLNQSQTPALLIQNEPALPVPQTVQTEIITPQLNAAPQAQTPALPIPKIVNTLPLTPVLAKQIQALQAPITVPTAQVIAPQTLIPPAITTKTQALNVRIEAITPPQITVQPPVSEGAPLPPIGETQKIVPNQNQGVTKAETLITQNQQATSLTGIVTNVTEGKLPVVTLFFPQIGTEQVFTLQVPSDNVTIGTQIQVTPQTSPSAQVLTTPLAQGLPLPALLAPQPWPALEEILQTLARTAPQTAQAIINTAPSPSNPAQFGPAVLFFIAAVRGGDLSQWLGQRAVEALRTQGKSGLLSRFVNDGTTMNRVASEPVQDWRAVNLPMLWEGDTQKIALYYKHERSDNHNNDQKPGGTRFVFDLALDAMGKVQLDGLFKPGRLDVVLRTEDTFSQASQAEMRCIYARALRETGVTGELSFQNQPDGWVTVSAKETSNLGVNA